MAVERSEGRPRRGQVSSAKPEPKQDLDASWYQELTFPPQPTLAARLHALMQPVEAALREEMSRVSPGEYDKAFAIIAAFTRVHT
jgi:hypothetical protein